MANELFYAGNPATDTGLTITARVYSLSGVAVGGLTSCTEVGTLAIYLGDMPSTAAGAYLVRFFDGSTLKHQERLHWSGSAIITLNTLLAATPANFSNLAITASGALERHSQKWFVDGGGGE